MIGRSTRDTTNLKQAASKKLWHYLENLDYVDEVIQNGCTTSVWQMTNKFNNTRHFHTIVEGISGKNWVGIEELDVIPESVWNALLEVLSHASWTPVLESVSITVIADAENPGSDNLNYMILPSPILKSFEWTIVITGSIRNWTQIRTVRVLGEYLQASAQRLTSLNLHNPTWERPLSFERIGGLLSSTLLTKLRLTGMTCSTFELAAFLAEQRNIKEISLIHMWLRATIDVRSWSAVLRVIEALYMVKSPMAKVYIYQAGLIPVGGYNKRIWDIDLKNPVHRRLHRLLGLFRNNALRYHYDLSLDNEIDNSMFTAIDTEDFFNAGELVNSI